MDLCLSRVKGVLSEMDSALGKEAQENGERAGLFLRRENKRTEKWQVVQCCMERGQSGTPVIDRRKNLLLTKRDVPSAASVTRGRNGVS